MSMLQDRARRAARLFAEKARKPLVIEFSGVPKAGKTTTLAIRDLEEEPRLQAERSSLHLIGATYFNNSEELPGERHDQGPVRIILYR